VNSLNLKDIKGIINYSLDVNDIYEEYKEILGINLYYCENLDLSIKYGLFLLFEKDKTMMATINVPLSIKNYLKIKELTDRKAFKVESVYSFLNLISNVYKINIILGFIKRKINQYFESYILVEMDSKYVCVNMHLTDILCMKEITDFPLFINKKLLEKDVYDFNEVGENVDASFLRLYV
jgi:hypothetical protein